MSETIPPEFEIAWPTLGYLQADWMAWHLPIPDGCKKGQPFLLSDWQLWCTANHGRVRPGTPWRPEDPIKNQAFEYRRSLIVGPQKYGKSPMGAGWTSVMALGPDLFAGWAEGPGEVYDCARYGCMCGFVYEYEVGEPMGMPWPTPLIQLMATSEDQVNNTWRPLQQMILRGPLSERVRVGEKYMRIGDEGVIEKVTSAESSRLGNPTTGFVQDETGIYTKTNGLMGTAQTMRRGTSGMGGRGIELTNTWDPAEESTARATYESRAKDIFRFYREPPKNLSYKNKRDRRKIHAYVYFGAAHVDLDGIEAEAYELLEQDPAQAERFYGNKLVRGMGSWLPDGLWEDAYAKPTAVAA
ncbi:terminase [Microbacterium thalli]|uniref:terminase n=1 Tax=Microbacterium thalli TaxID=3027921 RepID=UPI002367156C|nr:terminase [Microbacterium thalli]MDD7930082.1 terminase [Microbacterium thalli]